MQNVKLNDIAEFIRTGKTPPTSQTQYFDGPVNWYTPGDFNNGKKLKTSKRTLTQIALDDKKAITFPKDTLLITCIGDIGKIGITQELCSSNQQITGIKPKENTDVNYLYYWFIANKKVLENTANSAVVPILNNKTLQNIDFKFPNLLTQQKIAKILDKADELRQYNKQLIEKYDALTQSLFFDMFGDPIKNEKGWDKTELRNVTSKIGSGSTPRGGKEAYHTEGISLIRSLNIYDNEFKYKNLAFINDDQANKLKNVTVESNDVLFNITGASVCRCTVVPDEVLPARVNQHVSILRTISEKLHPLFLSHLLISENIKIQLLGVGSAGGAVMEAITKEQLEKFKILLPPIKDQNQFVARVQMIETQKQQAQEALAKSEELFQSLLQRAFKGELV